MKSRNRTAIAAALILALSSFTSRARAQAGGWRDIKIPPLPAFHPEQPRRIQLPNGMVIFLAEDHELPLIRGIARVRGGRRDDPAAKAGLAETYSEVWRTGGTRSKTGDQLDDFLEARGARVEAASGIDSTTLSFDCLKDSLNDVFPVFVDLLRAPEFRADKIPVAQEQLDTEIARRNENPAAIAAREARRLAYGLNSPYARQPEYTTVLSVTRNDLLDWHSTYVHPNNIILGVVGDFDAAQMEARLRAAFGDWPTGPVIKPLNTMFQNPKPGVYFAEKEDVNQANIQLVALGIRRNSPDYYAVRVLNELFGGGFSSRLMQDIRTAKGLAYGVGGGVGSEYDHPGLLQIVAGTKSGSTSAAIQGLFDEIDRLKSNPPSAAEVQKAKDSILNSFVFEFDSREKVLAERMAYEFYGYPADFLERYRAGIEKVTPADVERVAGKYFHRDELALIVVGKAADFDKPLTGFGKVVPLDITIPPPPKTGQSTQP
jgi:zinc protease